MKVIDKINELKGTDATIDDIVKWAYMNRVTLDELEEELELGEGKFPIEFNEMIDRVCLEEHEEEERYQLFLSLEVTP